LRHRFAEAGRSLVLDKFSVERQIEKTQELYWQACDEKKRRLIERLPQPQTEAAEANPELLNRQSASAAPPRP